ncbi:hypothetical protein [Salinibacterium sp.]|uniref:hypothetical protein n=1 Tax=Salinibacterium sp. TaxID=1915057 RepID=UPI00286D527B|nr:hypothetical protein [Salinibacterium sp.]
MNETSDTDQLREPGVEPSIRRTRTKVVSCTLVGIFVLGVGLAIFNQIDANSSEASKPEAFQDDPRVLSAACEDSKINAAVEKAIDFNAETSENGLLALPSQVPAGARGAQAATWNALSEEDRQFQLCLHLKQDGVSE